MKKAVANLKVDDGYDSGKPTGPLINEAALEKVRSHIEDAQEKGATVIEGGGRRELGQTFFEPTILTGMTSDMIVAREETFGPLAPLFKFETEVEVVALANDSEIGFAGYFYAKDINRVWRVAEKLETGMGREGSKYGIEDFLEIKYLCFGGIE